MNLTLYAVTALIILDTDGNRVLSKYYRQESNPPSSKGLAITKEQRAFEKGLWQKTKNLEVRSCEDDPPLSIALV